MQRLDVLFASPLFYPVYAGAGIRFQRYAPGLKERGIDFHVLAGAVADARFLSEFNFSEQPIGTIYPTTYVDGLPINYVSLPTSGYYQRQRTYMQALIRYCKHPATRPDIVHAISVSPYWLLWWLPLRNLGVPILRSYTLMVEPSANPLKRWIQTAIWRWQFQIADAVIVSTTTMRQSLYDLKVSRRIETIGNGVDLQRFRPLTDHGERVNLRKRLNLDPDGEIVLYVGALIKRKGFDLLVDVWRQIAHMRKKMYLILVGPEPMDIRGDNTSIVEYKTLLTHLQNSGAWDRVILTGHVQTVEDYFRIADVFVFPSLREGMGNVVLEAMASGVACVLTPYLGLSAEIGQCDEHYILVERSSAAISDAIIKLLSNPEERQQLGIRARQWAEMNFGLDRSLDQLSALYHEIVVKKDQGKSRL